MQEQEPHLVTAPKNAVSLGYYVWMSAVGEIKEVYKIRDVLSPWNNTVLKVQNKFAGCFKSSMCCHIQKSGMDYLTLIIGTLVTTFGRDVFSRSRLHHPWNASSKRCKFTLFQLWSAIKSFLWMPIVLFLWEQRIYLLNCTE
jgi:hypothetical protein